MNNKSMKWNIRRLVAGWTVLVLSVLTVAAAGRRIEVVPVQGKPVPVMIGGKESGYFLLSTKAPLVVEVDGPGKLTIVSRLAFPPTGASTGKYSISVSEGKKVVKTYSTQTDKSQATVKDSHIALGKIRKSTFPLPDGPHKYEFRLEGSTEQEAAIRFLFSPAKGASKRVTLEPLSYDRVVTAMVKEKLIAYYVCSATRKVQLRVIGPTRVDISARLSFDDRMKGSQKYTVSVWEGTKRILLKPFSTTKALGVMYQEWKEVVPGKVNTFMIDVPDGEHLLRLDFGESLGRSVAFKFSIPKRDLSNEG